jgi:hypothetical protein
MVLLSLVLPDRSHLKEDEGARADSQGNNNNGLTAKSMVALSLVRRGYDAPITSSSSLSLVLSLLRAKAI